MMKRQTIASLCATGVFAVAALSTLVPAYAAADAKKPYVVVDGNKLDKPTYKGFLYYSDQCLRCHGPDAAGSSYAPALTQSLKVMSQEDFQNTVINGRKHVDTANTKVMPAFGTNEDVVGNLDNIYAYIKARSDGVLKPGHPEHLEQ